MCLSVCGLWYVVCGLSSMSIDSHVQYISFSFYTIVKLTSYITLLSSFYYVNTVMFYYVNTVQNITYSVNTVQYIAVVWSIT